MGKAAWSEAPMPVTTIFRDARTSRAASNNGPFPSTHCQASTRFSERSCPRISSSKRESFIATLTPSRSVLRYRFQVKTDRAKSRLKKLKKQDAE
jgi:hypothetical protein